MHPMYASAHTHHFVPSTMTNSAANSRVGSMVEKKPNNSSEMKEAHG